MRFIGNIIWVLFGGFLLALEYFLVGIVLCCSVVFLPFGLQLFKCASLSLWPFGRVVVNKPTTGCLSTGMNILWIFCGLFLALQHFIIGLFFFITIIGIPFAKQHFKLAAIALTPFGKEIRSSKSLRHSVEEVHVETASQTEPIAAIESPATLDNLLQNAPIDRQKLYIGGGVLAALLVIGSIFYFTGSASNKDTFADKPIDEIFPPIQKVVEVIVETANLRTGPSTEYPIALDPMNAQEGAKYVVTKGERLAVMEEVDEWYKLAAKDKNGETTYIKKTLCQDLVIGIIPQENVYTDWFNKNFECGGGVSVVRQPKGNRLVVSYTHVECDADELLLGVYQDGAYLFYYSLPVTSLVYEEHNTGISLNKISGESIFYEGYYGKDMTRKVKYEWGEEEVLDWAKVPEDKLAEFFSLAISEGVKNIKILTARDIKENQEQKPEEDNGVLFGFSYVVDDGEFGLELYAETGEKKVATNIAGGAETLSIIGQGDYDNDGEKEALVYEWGGGNTLEPPYLVYYDKDEEVFKKVEGFDYISEDPKSKLKTGTTKLHLS